MAEKFNYTSVLAPYMNGVLQKKDSAGLISLRLRWIFKEFDDFANMSELESPSLTTDFIEAWRKTRLSDSERTLYAKWSAWHQLSTHMCRDGVRSYIPQLSRQPKSDFTPYIFTEDQIQKVFAAADSQRLYDIRMGTTLMPMPVILRLLYSTGMRVSEALSLANKDVDMQQGCLYLRKTKNGSERLVALHESMRLELQRYMDYRDKMPLKHVSSPNNLLFVKPDGTSIRANTVYQFFRKLLDECGIPHKGNHHGPRVHDLRHTNAVHALVSMAKTGIDLYTSLPIISANLGHHSLCATEQYVRLTASMYPDLVSQSKPANAFVYPKIGWTYEGDN